MNQKRDLDVQFIRAEGRGKMRFNEGARQAFWSNQLHLVTVRLHAL